MLLNFYSNACKCRICGVICKKAPYCDTNTVILLDQLSSHVRACNFDWNCLWSYTNVFCRC